MGKQDADVEITLASGRTLPPRCAATAAPRRPRSTTTSSTPSSANWSARCSAPSAPSDCWPPAGDSTNWPTSRSCSRRPYRSRWLTSTPEIALVTGAGSGLGAVIAERLARRGSYGGGQHQGAHRARPDAVAAAIRAGGGCAFAVTANVTDPSAVRRMFDAIAARGRLRVLVNNASYRRGSAFADDHRGGLASRFTLGHPRRRLPCIRYALPALIPGGRIVNILGRNALAGDPERVHLSAAKHGLLGLTVALAAALRDDGVAVNAVSPGIDCDVTDDLDAVPRRNRFSGRASGLRGAAELTGTVVRVDCDGSEVVSASHGVVSVEHRARRRRLSMQRKGGVGQAFPRDPARSRRRRARGTSPSARRRSAGCPGCRARDRPRSPPSRRRSVSAVAPAWVCGTSGSGTTSMRAISARTSARRTAASENSASPGPAVQQRDRARERHRELALQTRSRDRSFR